MSKQNNVQTTNQGTTAVIMLSVLLAFLLGGIIGFFVGENRAEERLAGVIPTTTQSTQTTPDNQETTEPAVAVDYSKFVINEAKNITIDNFYGDAETKGYAANLIGKPMPVIEWKNAKGETFTTKDMKGKYIIEIFSTTCQYCIASIPELEKFRDGNSDISVISLTPDPSDTSDIKQFNANGEVAFFWEAKEAGANEILSNMPWVPGFIYVEDGVVQLVSYGGVTLDSLNSNVEVAFE